MLRMGPGQRKRLIEIIRSLADRIKEAKHNGWLGETEGLQVSLLAAGEEWPPRTGPLHTVQPASLISGSILQIRNREEPS
ncbi:hypothetical protein ACFYXV_33925 [Streptomyces sp. NPDC002181]|uniref:hypothetical protein n=1 Tax=Streptomyces sp. NPDC002181 TaxID=3364635 RepID=UPI00368A54B7